MRSTLTLAVEAACCERRAESNRCRGHAMMVAQKKWRWYVPQSFSPTSLARLL